MSIDRSLKLKSSLERHRNVLSRAERLAKLLDGGKWDASRGALHLPKVAHRKSKAGGKKKEAAEAAAATTEAAPAAAATGTAAAAAPAQKSAPAGKPDKK